MATFDVFDATDASGTKVRATRMRDKTILVTQAYSSGHLREMRLESDEAYEVLYDWVTTRRGKLAVHTDLLFYSPAWESRQPAWLRTLLEADRGTGPVPPGIDPALFPTNWSSDKWRFPDACAYFRRALGATCFAHMVEKPEGWSERRSRSKAGTGAS